LRAADAVMVGSHVQHGPEVLDRAREQAGTLAFHDIDTPITLARMGRPDHYVRAEQVPRLDLYLSFTGGPTLDRIEHLPPARHPGFYKDQDWTLNATRTDMVAAGWSPSMRLFEAAACATPIVSDHWEGLDELFPEGEAIVIARGPEDVEAALDLPAARREPIGLAAHDIVRARPRRRARDLPGGSRRRDPAALPDVPDTNDPAALGPWFHNLPLPGGVQTAPDHRFGGFPRFEWREIAPHIPEDLTGWRALDVGCNAGPR
jgi:hypothetical protein